MDIEELRTKYMIKIEDKIVECLRKIDNMLLYDYPTAAKGEKVSIGEEYFITDHSYSDYPAVKDYIFKKIIEYYSKKWNIKIQTNENFRERLEKNVLFLATKKI